MALLHAYKLAFGLILIKPRENDAGVNASIVLVENMALLSGSVSDVSLVHPQPVTNSGFCQDQLWRLGTGLDLGPQLSDEDPQILRVVGVGRAPDGGEDLAMGDDAAGMAHQRRQQVELLWRQLDRLPVLDDAPLFQVDDKPVGLVTWRGGLVGREWRKAVRSRARNSPMAKGFAT